MHIHLHLHLHTHKYIYVLPAPPPPTTPSHRGEGGFHHPTSPIIHPSIIHSSFIIPSSNIPHHPSSSSRLPTPPSHRGGGGKSPSCCPHHPTSPSSIITIQAPNPTPFPQGEREKPPSCYPLNHDLGGGGGGVGSLDHKYIYIYIAGTQMTLSWLKFGPCCEGWNNPNIENKPVLGTVYTCSLSLQTNSKDLWKMMLGRWFVCVPF